MYILVKPASSKAGNSELYLVMENYSGEMHPLQNTDSFLTNLLEMIFKDYSKNKLYRATTYDCNIFYDGHQILLQSWSQKGLDMIAMIMKLET